MVEITPGIPIAFRKKTGIAIRDVRSGTVMHIRVSGIIPAQRRGMDEQRTHIDRYNLAALRTELEALGMVVVPFADELHVRLPMLEYVKIRVEDGSLHCTSWVGLRW